jgi:hypothetical protein
MPPADIAYDNVIDRTGAVVHAAGRTCWTTAGSTPLRKALTM